MSDLIFQLRHERFRWSARERASRAEEMAKERAAPKARSARSIWKRCPSRYLLQQTSIVLSQRRPIPIGRFRTRVVDQRIRPHAGRFLRSESWLVMLGITALLAIAAGVASRTATNSRTPLRALTTLTQTVVALRAVIKCTSFVRRTADRFTLTAWAGPGPSIPAWRALARV